MTDLLTVVAVGVGAGVLSGLFGVGGGILFVPALTLGLGLGQLEAEATSLAAMVPVVALGAARQHRDGLVDVSAALVIGLVSVAGVLAGAALATSLSNDALRRAFGAFLLVTAIQLALRVRSAQARRVASDAAGEAP